VRALHLLGAAFPFHPLSNGDAVETGACRDEGWGQRDPLVAHGVGAAGVVELERVVALTVVATLGTGASTTSSTWFSSSGFSSSWLRRWAFLFGTFATLTGAAQLHPQAILEFVRGLGG